MPIRIGIALGGGGARGLAHLGVLKALESARIPVHCITGASVGAIAGAMYAQTPDADLLIEKVKQTLDEEFLHKLRLDSLRTDGYQNGSSLHQMTQRIRRRIVINLAQNRQALLKGICLKDMLAQFIDGGNIEDTKIPLGVVATNIHTGEQVEFTSGDIIAAVAASASIPGYFPPIQQNGDLLIDGAVHCPMPVKLLRDMGADLAIGVEISTRTYHPLENMNVIEIIARAEMIESKRLSEMMVSTADVAIRPDTKDIYWSDFTRVDELIEVGIKSTEEKIPEIKRAIQRNQPWYKRLHYSDRKHLLFGRFKYLIQILQTVSSKATRLETGTD